MNKKRTYLLTVGVMCIMLMVGCNKDSNNNANPTPSNKITEVASVTPEVKSNKISAEPTLPLTETKDISIYSINSETIEKEAVTALVPADTEITPEFIVNTVVDSMADESFMIGIDSVTTNNDVVIVSFLDDQPPVVNVGAGAEGEILDAIAQSLLDNLPDYNKVIFQIKGEAYVTGHYQFEKDHVYMEK